MKYELFSQYVFIESMDTTCFIHEYTPSKDVDKLLFTKKPNFVPGLSFYFFKSENFYVVNIIHDASGIPLVHDYLTNSANRVFIDCKNEDLISADWTLSAEEIRYSQDHKECYNKIRSCHT